MDLDFLFGVIDPIWAGMVCAALIAWAFDSWRGRGK